MTRTEHLRWAKTRALEYVAAGDNTQAFASFASDLSKHPDLAQSRKLHAELGAALLLGGHLRTQAQMRDWIEGFN
jgi:hypothetical protein